MKVQQTAAQPAPLASPTAALTAAPKVPLTVVRLAPLASPTVALTAAPKVPPTVAPAKAPMTVGLTAARDHQHCN